MEKGVLNRAWDQKRDRKHPPGHPNNSTPIPSLDCSPESILRLIRVVKGCCDNDHLASIFIVCAPLTPIPHFYGNVRTSLQTRPIKQIRGGVRSDRSGDRSSQFWRPVLTFLETGPSHVGDSSSQGALRMREQAINAA
jgi:hypothetical protein